MASDAGFAGRASGRRSAEAGFFWVASSPSPEAVERLEASFPEVVRFPEEELATEVAGWQQSAIVARSFHRWVPSEAYLREFRRIGIPGEITTVSLSCKCHVFRFDSPEACNLVMQRPWVINGQVIGIEAWRPEFAPAEDSIPSALIWVRLPNLPLEFWKEDFLKSILASAGDYICADAATLAKNRGAYARVCLRVDLSRPLRPGARIQGIYQTFWQQFSYENLQGICLKCGSIHLGNPCSNPPGPGEVCSASDSAYGPWIAVVREWRSASGPQAAGKGPPKPKASLSNAGRGMASTAASGGLRPGTAGADEGWSSPTKVSRRRSSSARKVVVVQGAAPNQAGIPQEQSSNGEEGVPVLSGCAVFKGIATVTSAVEEISREPAQLSSMATKNPFSSLGMDKSSDSLLDCTDGSLGSLKRARSEVSKPPRSFSNSVVRKAKGKAPAMKRGGPKLSSPVRSDLSDRGLEGGLGLVKSLSDQGVGSSSEVVAGDLVGQGSGSLADVSAIELERASGCAAQMSDVGSEMVEGPTDSIMLEDQGAVPVSSNL